MIRSEKISPHFWWSEAVTTLQPELQAEPTNEQRHNARILALCVLEPIRAIWGLPMDIESWTRSARLNRVVGGVDNSLHLDALAVDCRIRGVSRAQMFQGIEDDLFIPTGRLTVLVYSDRESLHLGYRWWEPMQIDYKVKHLGSVETYRGDRHWQLIA